MSNIIPFDFEEQAVRVIMRDGEPWFVAADVCRVLDIKNTSDATGRLDDDERMTLDLTEGHSGQRGGARSMNLVSESGLYALVMRSDKPAAKRFRKWITAEVLPAIRKTGRYVAPKAMTVEPEEGTLPGGGTLREAEAWLSMVREARLLAGNRAGMAMWSRSPLPPLHAAPRVVLDPAAGRRCLAWLLARLSVDLEPQLVGDDATGEILSPCGLRLVDGGLFVANRASVFQGGPWAGGQHRSALLALDGVDVDPTVRTLLGQRVRGILVPWSLLLDKAAVA